MTAAIINWFDVKIIFQSKTKKKLGQTPSSTRKSTHGTGLLIGADFTCYCGHYLLMKLHVGKVGHLLQNTTR